MFIQWSGNHCSVLVYYFTKPPCTHQADKNEDNSRFSVSIMNYGEVTSAIKRYWPFENGITGPHKVPVMLLRFHVMTSSCIFPDSTVREANMGPTWVLSAPDGPHVGPMNLAIWVTLAPAGSRHVAKRWSGGLTDKTSCWMISRPMPRLAPVTRMLRARIDILVPLSAKASTRWIYTTCTSVAVGNWSGWLVYIRDS